MRTALPAPAFLRAAREARRDDPENCPLCTPQRSQVPYHFPVDRHGHVTVEQARADPNAFIEYVLRDGSPRRQAAWAEHLAVANRSVVLAPVGAGMSRGLPTMDERLADVSRGIARQLDRLVADANGWSPVTLADRFLAAGPPAPDPEADRYIAVHAVDDIIGRRPGGFTSNP